MRMNMNQKQHDQHEEGIEIPFEQINPDTLLKMIEEFVTREWEGTEESSSTLEDKVSQVLRQMKAHTAKVVYDLATESWNIVACK